MTTSSREKFRRKLRFLRNHQNRARDLNHGKNPERKSHDEQERYLRIVITHGLKG